MSIQDKVSPGCHVADAVQASNLQFRLAELYLQEHSADGTTFDQNYLRINQKYLAKAYVEQHKRELACAYLAHKYAEKHRLSPAYVDQYPEQLAQNYIIEHATVLARSHVHEHGVELSERRLSSNRLDLAQRFIDEHQADLAQRYLLKYSDSFFRACARGLASKPALTSKKSAPEQSSHQLATALPVGSSPQIPTVAILTGCTGAFTMPSTGIAEGLPTAKSVVRARPRNLHARQVQPPRIEQPASAGKSADEDGIPQGSSASAPVELDPNAPPLLSGSCHADQMLISWELVSQVPLSEDTHSTLPQ